MLAQKGLKAYSLTGRSNTLFDPKKAIIRAFSTLFTVSINVISNG